MIVSCSPEQKLPPEDVVSGINVVARWKTCPKPSEREGPPQLERASWQGSAFVVVVKDNDYCGGTDITDPRYELAGEDLKLRWAWKAGPNVPVTACTCDHTVHFELSSLMPKDYKVLLVRDR